MNRAQLPPIICLSTSGGFEHQLEALEGQPPTQLGSVMQGLIGAANQDHNLARVFSTFTATNPSIFRGGRTRTCKCLLYELEPLDRPKRQASLRARPPITSLRRALWA
jgi:hypothetical protein